MRETEWVEIVAEAVRADVKNSNQDQSLRVRTQLKIPYGYEIIAYGKERVSEINPFTTDFAVVEEQEDGSWKPRVVVEAKLNNISTHDVITYSQKAAHHRSVFPYLRYGIMLGNRQHYPLPGRLYRHGTQFDFMISFKEHEPTQREIRAFLNLLLEEVRASKALENMIYQSRRKDRDYYTLFHRRLTVDDISAESKPS